MRWLLSRGWRVLTALTLLTLILPASGGVASYAQSGPPKRPADTTSVTIAGSFQQELGCPGDWQPDCHTTDLTYDAADDVWEESFSIPAGNWEYKAALNGTWDVSYPPNNVSLVLTATTTVKFYYDDKTHWVADNHNTRIVTAPGSFQSELGCPGDWQPDCLRSMLENQPGSPVYTFETTNIAAGSYEVKAAINESWDENYGLGGVPGGANIPFTVASQGQPVRFRYDDSTHVLTVSVGSGHAHDNNVDLSGLAHDSRTSLYRVPYGAVNPRTPVTVRLRTFSNDVTAVTLRLYDTAVAHEDRQAMPLTARNVGCYDTTLPPDATCDYWQATYTPAALGTIYYRFIVQDGTATAYYADTVNRYGGIGIATADEQDNGFRLQVVDPAFPVVPWVENGVQYQIFLDRFRNGDPANDPAPTEPRYDYPAPPNATPEQIAAAARAQIQDRRWNQLPEGYCRNYANPATACTEQPQGRDYFGGDFQGLHLKLPYLQRLGITVIYLNPVFESGSNHGYDTRDYQQISHYFGTNSYFQNTVVPDARAHGIRIILDGVFNHLSSDSPFFDRYHHYTSVGACESLASPYRSWFIFHDVALGQGPCVGRDATHSATYDGWAGFDSIPVIQKKDPAHPEQPYAPVAQYFYANILSSVAPAWLRRGAAGWRFDVMQDPSFPVSYWEQVRAVTKGVRPDTVLISEAWHWYDVLPLAEGNTADATMSYRFRNAVFGLLGAVDNKGFPQENDPNLPPSVFATRMNSIREDYADSTYYTSQNLLDSHDTRRLLWSLTPGENNREQKEFNSANLATGKARQHIAALVQMTVPGSPTIYYGDEVGLTGDDDPDDRRVFPWKIDASGNYVNTNDTSYYDADGDHALFDWYRQLTGIRAATPVLRQGKLTFLLTDDTNKTLAYAMRMPGALAIVVINRNETQTQNITVPTGNYVRDGIILTNTLGSGVVTLSEGQFQVNLQPLRGAIFVMGAGQRIDNTHPPTGLSAASQNGITSTVTLSWTVASGAVSYRVYRSPVQGGGYVQIGTTNSHTYADVNVPNGTTYYYVVRAVDALGNVSSPSNEANATPAYPIGYAVVQFPKTIGPMPVTATYTTVYGQVYIAGLTDSHGDPNAIIAQIGLGPQGSNPTTWTWRDMVYNAGHTGDNNYEYMAGIRADTPGTYSYLVRFSDDGGRTWTYGDQNGVGTGTPGVLTLTASSDTTAPTAPTASLDWSATALYLTWTASTDPDDTVAEYRIYRGTTPGGESATPLAIVTGARAFTDTTVLGGQTYYYKIRAFDTALNPSTPSNEVSHRVEAKIIQVTFRVKVPAFTPAEDTIYISGDQSVLCGYCGGGTPGTTLHRTAPGSRIWEITLPFAEGTPIQYKYTRGTYDYVEEWGTIIGFTNRVATVRGTSNADLTQLVDDTSDTIADDNHRAVQNWRDALVTHAAPTGLQATPPVSITVGFNWDVVPASGRALSDTITVMQGGVRVPGTVTHYSATQTLVFSPTRPFAGGVYTVTVNNVSPLTPQSDGIAIRTPYVFAFVTYASCPLPFSDVDTGNPFYDFIRCLLCHGVISGYGDSTFRPANSVTRGQMAKFISEAAGYTDTITATQQSFSDVPPGHPFWLYVERVKRHGVVSGYGDGTFRPGNEVTRGQTAKFIAIAGTLTDDVSGRHSFTDVPTSDTFYPYIERVKLHGVVSGYGDNTFRPTNSVTRGQLTKFVNLTFFPGCMAPPR